MANGVYTSGHFRVPEHEIEEVLTRTGLEYKRGGNDQFMVKECPFCEASGHPIRGKSDNMWKMYVTRDTGAYFCHRCGSKGSFFDYKKNMGLISPIEHMSGQRTKEYKLPKQEIVTNYPAAMQFFPDLFDYCVQKRGITKETLEWYRVGATTYKFQDDSGKWMDEECITFPWIEYTPAGREVTVRVKARSVANKKNMRLDPTGGRWGWFGWHTVPNDAKEIVVTEGEWDAMSVWQATKIPAISLPNGSRSLPPELLVYLERFETVYLWMDDDVAGQDGAIQFARKIGDRRTKIVPTRLDTPNGPKDANECLQRGEDLWERINAAQALPHEEVMQVKDLKAEIFREILNPKEVDGMPIDILPKLQTIMKGHRRGELTILTGGTGQGKTTILGQHSMLLAQRGVRTCWGSFEIKNHKLGKKMLYQFARKALHKFPGELEQYWQQFTQMPMWMMKFFGSTSIDKVLDAMDYCVYVLDVEHFIIDNLQFMLAGQTKGQNKFSKFDVQDEAIDRLRAFATKKNVHVTLVIHPKKVTEGMEMDLTSIGGTAKAGQEADNVWMLQKGPWYRYLDVRKAREHGDLGMVPYEFDRETYCIRELTEEQMDEKKNTERETAQTHGVVSQLGNKPGGLGGRMSGKKKSKDHTDIPNLAPSYLDGTAYRNAKSIGAQQD